MPRTGVDLLRVGLPTRSGLRNRRRDGRGTYSTLRKGRTADHYGQVRNGSCTDVIGGHPITWKPLQEV